MIPYTSIPLISACFLVMVGVLIGHLIWYRYRDEQQQKAADLYRKIEELRSSLDVQTSDTAEARLKLNEVEGILVSEREAMAELQARLATHESLYESAAADLEESEQVSQQLREQTAQQEQELGKFRVYAEQAASNISKLEARLSELSTKSTEELQAVHSDLESSNAAHAAIVRQLSQRDARLLELEDSHRTWQEHADSADAEVTRLTELLQRQEARLVQQSHELEDISSLRQEREQLRAALRQSQEQLEVLRNESSVSMRQLSDQVADLSRSNLELERSEKEYARQLEAQVELSDDLSAKIEAALSDLGRLNQRAAELQHVKVDRDRLIDELDNRQDQIKRLTHDLDQALAADVEARQQLDQAQQQLDGLQVELQQSSVQRDQASDQLRQAEQRRQSLERSLAAASEEVAQLQVERERLEGIEDEFVELDAKRRELTKDLELARRERDEALGAESSTREIVVELRDELSDRLESIQQLEDQRNDAVAELEQERAKHQAAQDEIVASNQKIESLQQQQLTLQRRHDETVSELDRLKAELETAKSLYAQVADQVAMYRQDTLNSRTADAAPPQRSVSSERSERASGATRRRKSAFSFRRAQRREEDVRAREKANSRRDQRLGTIFTEAPLRCDDLTEIQGIDAKVNQQLNALGVYTFKQVMEWNSQVSSEFSQQLGTDSILKEDWIGQARRLYHRHYPAAA